MKLVLTRRTDYAIRAMVHLAQRRDLYVKADQIADAVDVPRTFIPHLLQDLQRARLVVSRPGRNGGYSLSRPADEVSVLDIVKALEGHYDTDADCALRGGPCHLDELCAMHWVWSEAREAVEARLGEANLARVALDDEKRRAPKRSRPPAS